MDFEARGVDAKVTE